MILKNFSDVEEEIPEIRGGSGIKVRWLIDDEIGLNFAMRRYELKGVIPQHRHFHEHEIYFLEGKGEITDNEGKIKEVKKGDFVYVPPNEVHGIRNLESSKSLIFLCLVPKKRGKPEFVNA